MSNRTYNYLIRIGFIFLILKAHLIERLYAIPKFSMKCRRSILKKISAFHTISVVHKCYLYCDKLPCFRHVFVGFGSLSTIEILHQVYVKEKCVNSSKTKILWNVFKQLIHFCPTATCEVLTALLDIALGALLTYSALSMRVTTNYSRSL